MQGLRAGGLAGPCCAPLCAFLAGVVVLKGVSIVTSPEKHGAGGRVVFFPPVSSREEKKLVSLLSHGCLQAKETNDQSAF